MKKYTAMLEWTEHGISANSEEEATKIFIENLIKLLETEDIGIITWEDAS